MNWLCHWFGHKWLKAKDGSEWIAGDTSAAMAHHRQCIRCGYVEND